MFRNRSPGENDHRWTLIVVSLVSGAAICPNAVIVQLAAPRMLQMANPYDRGVDLQAESLDLSTNRVI